MLYNTGMNIPERRFEIFSAKIFVWNWNILDGYTKLLNTMNSENRYKPDVQGSVIKLFYLLEKSLS